MNKVRVKGLRLGQKRVKVGSKGSSQGHVRVIICGKNLEEWDLILERIGGRILDNGNQRGDKV